ncbi:MAG TPA: EamA family transporter, partial [Magnetospirillaceae bacterium]|nr:EamA family transporter [Magnetospirillaceae bacterium]
MIRPYWKGYEGYFYALAATALWSGNHFIARALREAVPPVSLAFLRWATATAVFLPFALRG